MENPSPRPEPENTPLKKMQGKSLSERLYPNKTKEDLAKEQIEARHETDKKLLKDIQDFDKKNRRNDLEKRVLKLLVNQLNTEIEFYNSLNEGNSPTKSPLPKILSTSDQSIVQVVDELALMDLMRKKKNLTKEQFDQEIELSPPKGNVISGLIEDAISQRIEKLRQRDPAKKELRALINDCREAGIRLSNALDAKLEKIEDER